MKSCVYLSVTFYVVQPIVCLSINIKSGRLELWKFEIWPVVGRRMVGVELNFIFRRRDSTYETRLSVRKDSSFLGFFSVMWQLCFDLKQIYCYPPFHHLLRLYWVLKYVLIHNCLNIRLSYFLYVHWNKWKLSS